MSRFQIYLYPCIFICTCALLSLVNSLQSFDPVWIPENLTNVSYDPLVSNNGSTLNFTRKILPRPLEYGKFDFNAIYKGNQEVITGQILVHENGTRELSLKGLYRVVTYSKSLSKEGDEQFNVFDELYLGLCPTASSGIGSIGLKVIRSTAG